MDVDRAEAANACTDELMTEGVAHGAMLPGHAHPGESRVTHGFAAGALSCAAKSKLQTTLSTAIALDLFRVCRVLSQHGTSGDLLCEVGVPGWPMEFTAAAAAADGVEFDNDILGPALRDSIRTPLLQVALKVLVGGSPAGGMSKFYSLHTLPSHPNVLPVLGLFAKRLPPTVYSSLPSAMRVAAGAPTNAMVTVVTPWLSRSLAHAARSGPPPSGQAFMQWSLQVASAVTHMWRHGWTLWGLTLDSVLVAEDGRAVLADFGAVDFRAGVEGLMAPPGADGVAANCAPELLEAHRRALGTGDMADVLAQVDLARHTVWALGVALHELMAAAHPYGAAYPLRGHEEEASVDEVTLLARGVCAPMVAVLRRMVCRDAASRPANPELAYQELLAAVPAAARSDSGPAALVAPGATEATEAAEAAAVADGAALPSGTTAFAASAGSTASIAPATTTLDTASASLHGCHSTAPSGFAAASSGPVVQSASVPHAPLSAAVVAAAACHAGPAPPSATRTRDMVRLHWEARTSLAWDEEAGAAVPNSSCARLEAYSRGADGASDDEVHAAQLCVAILLFQNEGGLPRDRSRAVDLARANLDWCSIAAGAGDATALWLLGRCLDEGIGTDVDKKQSVSNYLRAAQRGCVSSLNNLGLHYEFAEGVERDDSLAAKYYQRAAEQGHAAAQTNLGLCFEEGVGGPKCSVRATNWLRRAAAQGLATAQFVLGDRCLRRVSMFAAAGCPEAAIVWLECAARQGYGDAQLALSHCCHLGQDVPQDPAKAALWFRFAQAAQWGFGERAAQWFAWQAPPDGSNVECVVCLSAPPGGALRSAPCHHTHVLCVWCFNALRRLKCPVCRTVLRAQQ